MAKKSILFKFGEKLRKLRKQKGWSQRDLAKRAGVSRGYLSVIESKRPPDVTVDVIQKLAKAFRIPISDLLRF